ncbi:MAG TPA: glycosyltransferase family 39 protein, partial [Thermoanaerobaculia bacterium]
SVSAGRAIHLSPWALSWIQIVGTLAAALLVALTARALAGEMAGLAAALALLASRTVVLNASELEPEVLILLLNALAIWLLLGKERPSPFLAGVAAAASVMTRPTAILPLIVLGALAARDRWKRFLAGAAIPIVLILGVNVAITHQPIVMNGGTVLYEGMNPHASGYSGVRPYVVDDLRISDPAIENEPDPLHVAFRMVVSRIHHDAATPEETNRYWTGKALAFVREFPGAAARLTLRKLFFALHSYEAWDVRRTAARSATVGPLWLPFGLLLALSLIALVVLRADRRVVVLACIVAAYVCAMAIFHVTSRQRNALMPAIAVLAGVGITAIFYGGADALVRPAARPRGFAAWADEGVRPSTEKGVAAALVTLLLMYNYAPQREHSYFEREKAIVNGGLSDPALLTTYPAGVDRDIPIAQPAAVRAAATRELAHADSDARRFDIAHGLVVAGEWVTAEKILRSLEDDGYRRPWRGLGAVSSVAFYRSIALLHLRRPAEARGELLQAQREAPADDSVLALTAIAFRNRDSARRLFAIYDPFTARLAIVRAYMVLRRLPEALTAASALTKELPEWKRAGLIETELRDYSSPR